MAKKIRTTYDTLCAEINEKVKKAGSTTQSKTDLVAMTQGLLNCPEHDIEVYSKGETGGAPVVKTISPSKRYRESLKPVLKQFGIDKDELQKVEDITFSKEHAAAVCEVATTVIKDYTGVGRKFVFPITSETESQMSIAQVNVGNKTNETRKIVKDEATGKYNSVPTGKTVTTKAHTAMKASNKIPYWLKSEK